MAQLSSDTGCPVELCPWRNQGTPALESNTDEDAGQYPDHRWAIKFRAQKVEGGTNDWNLRVNVDSNNCNVPVAVAQHGSDTGRRPSANGPLWHVDAEPRAGNRTDTQRGTGARGKGTCREPASPGTPLHEPEVSCEPLLSTNTAMGHERQRQSQAMNIQRRPQPHAKTYSGQLLNAELAFEVQTERRWVA